MPFLPSSLYTSGTPLVAAMAQQKDSQATVVAHSVAESSLKAGFMAPAPTEKKIAMYSRVRQPQRPGSPTAALGGCIVDHGRRGGPRSERVCTVGL